MRPILLTLIASTLLGLVACGQKGALVRLPATVPTTPSATRPPVQLPPGAQSPTNEVGQDAEREITPPAK